jgi:16S rRNA (cytidine1402-2'-O)-methyltransferase
MPKGQPLPAVERTLYVVATPIGNLRDITLRALDILGQVDIIAAEDTRVTSALTAHYELNARLMSLHEHNERRRADEIVALLAAGKRVAFVTDAGTPGISDPGAVLVGAVANAGFSVVPIPGPCAAIAALSAAGVTAPHWLFYGFLPATAKARHAALDALRMLPFALVFYEAPHRIAETMADLGNVLGSDRSVVVARELTKRFETIVRGALGDVAQQIQANDDAQRGEFVIVVDAPTPASEIEAIDAQDTLLSALLGEVPLAQAVRIAVALTGLPKNRLYARALALQAAAAG